MHPQAEADEGRGNQREHDGGVAEYRAAAQNVERIVETNAGAGNEDDVDLGVAEEPEEVLIEEGVAAFGGIEEVGVTPTRRSMASKVLAIITAGMAKMTMKL